MEIENDMGLFGEPVTKPKTIDRDMLECGINSLPHKRIKTKAWKPPIKP